MLDLSRLTPEQAELLSDEKKLAKLPPKVLAVLLWQVRWASTVRDKQRPPVDDGQGNPWSEWGLLAGRGFGKLLQKSEPIPTPDGWTTMGDLRVGDRVYDEAGQPCRVTATFEPPVTQAYRFAFSDGSTIVSDADHQWVTWTHAERKAFLRSPYEDTTRFPENWPQWRLKRMLGRQLSEETALQALLADDRGESQRQIARDLGVSRKALRQHLKAGTYVARKPVTHPEAPGPRIRTTAEIVATLTHGARGDTNHCIPCAAPLQGEAVHPFVAPYTLGVWLGDGSTAGARITCHENDQVFVRAAIEAEGYATTSQADPQAFGVLNLLPDLRRAGVLGDKHVPAIYLRASIEQRLALLQGLMDTDGNIEGGNTVAFVNTNRRLVDAVEELVVSLGMKAKVWSGVGRLNGAEHKPFWRVQFTPTMNPFRLPRKANRVRLGGAQSLRNHHRMIVSAEPLAPEEAGPMRCITVDSPNSMYLAGRAMIPTHNTATGAQWLAHDAHFDEHALPSYVIAPTLNDVRFTCFEGPAGLLGILPPQIVLDYNKTNLMITIETFQGKPTVIRGFSAEEPERLRGPQAARAWCFIAGTGIATPDGERPIESLRVGDLVLTRDGPRRVSATRSRTAPVGEVRLSNGRQLVGTAEHLVYTDCGWTSLSELQKGVGLCALNASSGTARRGIATAGDTTSGRTRSSVRKRAGSTSRSGSTTTALFQQDITFITSTRTRGTTTSATSLAFQAGRTRPITRWGGSFPNETGPWSPIFTFSVRSAAPASSARKRRPGRSASPAGIGRPNRDATSSRGRASSAGPYSKPDSDNFAVSVASTWQPLGQTSVYCLTVEGKPEFYANGVLVHNCDEIAAWGRDEETFDMMMFGMRLGPNPKTVWTTTPKPKELVRRLVKPRAGRVITTGSTYENRANLAPTFFDQVAQYEGTQLGRQELEGELIDLEEGGIVSRSNFRLWPADKPLPAFDLIILSLDTAYTEKTLDKKNHDPDPTACVVGGVFWHEDVRNVLILDCWDDFLGLPALVQRVKKEKEVHYGAEDQKATIKPLVGGQRPRGAGHKPDVLLIEDKGSGISLRQTLEREGIITHPYNPGRADKTTRLHVVSPVFHRQRVWLPESPRNPGKPMSWTEKMVGQLCSFRGSGSIKHDDYVDALSQLVRFCMDKGFLPIEKRKKPGEPGFAEDRPKAKVVSNPYAM